MDQLLRKIVQVTESWPCHELESLFSFLELTINMEKNEENLCLTIEECLSQFSKLRNIKMHVKKEKND